MHEAPAIPRTIISNDCRPRVEDAAYGKQYNSRETLSIISLRALQGGQVESFRVPIMRACMSESLLAITVRRPALAALVARAPIMSSASCLRGSRRGYGRQEPSSSTR